MNETDSLRLLQYLTMVLMSVYGHRDLVRKAGMQVSLIYIVYIPVLSILYMQGRNRV